MRIPFAGDARDVAVLREKLALYRDANGTLDELSVAAEDGVAYETLIAALDAARAEGFSSIAL